MGGWIKIHRDILQNWVWGKKPFSYGQAWIDLLLNANHKDGKVFFSSQVIDCKRGEQITSEVKLAEKYGWSRGRLRNFLALLQHDKMVTANKTATYTRLIIENYEEYQDIVTGDDTGDDTDSSTGRRQVAVQVEDTNKNVKNNKELIKKETKAKKERGNPASSTNGLLEIFKTNASLELKKYFGIDDVIKNWIEFREEKKARLTERAFKIQIELLNNESDPVAVINKSIQSNWTGLFSIDKKSIAVNNKSGGRSEMIFKTNYDEFAQHCVVEEEAQ